MPDASSATVDSSTPTTKARDTAPRTPVASAPEVVVAAPPAVVAAEPTAGDRPRGPLDPSPAGAPRPSPPHAVEAYWGLREAPFDNSPNPRFLYLTPEHETALARLLYAVIHRKGCATLTGGYGSGKTMLVRELLRRLPSERYEVAMLTNPRGSTVEFWREVLWELGVETTETARPLLVRLVNDRLYHNYLTGRDTVIVIDEAQLIGDDAILEELRLLLNLQADDRFLATIILVGSSALRARLGHLDHVAQRIAVRCHLAPMDLSRTETYISHRLRVAGLGQKIFTDEAIRLVAELSEGAPRKINTLCDLALLIGYEGFAAVIDGNVVAAASRNSQPDAVDERGSGAEGSRPDGARRALRGDPPPPLDPGPRRFL